MSYFQSFGYLPLIDETIEAYGKGVPAAVLGQQYGVYRLSNTTNDSIISGTPVYAQYPASIIKLTSKKFIENVTFELEVFDFTTNNLNLQLGDVLVENGYESDGGQYVFAQHRPLFPNVFVRVERNINLTRPNPGGGQSEQQPSTGSVVAPKYIGVKKSTELYLTLTNGQYSMQTTGNMASVPFGLQPQNRIKTDHKPDFPTQVPTVQFVGYLPLLPGIQVMENDIINSDAGDRYVVAQVFQSDTVGLQGWILILRKMAT